MFGSSSKIKASTTDDSHHVESEHAALATLARDALRESIRARRWRIFFRFVFLGLLLLIVMAPLLGGFFIGKQFGGSGGKHAAVIEVSGLISSGSPANANDIISALESALADQGTSGIILKINSPGGSPVQAGQVFDEIIRIREEHSDTPVYAVITDIGASGGYYIAAAAEKIYADRASAVGSIGVRLDSFGVVDAMQKLGIERRSITAGENKAILDPFLDVNPQHRVFIQQVVDDIHTQFITAVKQGRGDRLSDDENLFSGLFWSGTQAVTLGLVDELASVRTVARDVLGVSRSVDFTKRERPLERLLGEVRHQVVLTFESLLHPAVR